MKFLEKPGVLPIILAMSGALSLQISHGINDSKASELFACKEIAIETSDGQKCNVENFKEFFATMSNIGEGKYITEEIELPKSALESASAEEIRPMTLLNKLNKAILSKDPTKEVTKIQFLLGADPYEELGRILGVKSDSNAANRIAFESPKRETINHSNWMNIASDYIHNLDTSEKPARPIASASLQKTIKSIGKEKGVPFLLLLSIAEQESAFNPKAKSNAGAIGLCQLLPSTALWLVGKDFNDPDELAKMEQKLLNPEYNLRLGATYIKRLSSMFSGDIDKILAAYNAGPGSVRKYDGIPPFDETVNYVHKVKARVVLNHEDYLVQQPRNNLSDELVLVQNEDHNASMMIK